LLDFEQAQEEIGETDDRAAPAVANPPDRLGSPWNARCAKESPSMTRRGLFMVRCRVRSQSLSDNNGFVQADDQSDEVARLFLGSDEQP